MLISAILFFSCLYLYSIGRFWKITPDSASYVIGAQSIAAGKGYTENGKPVKLFPPATSMIYAVSLVFFPDDYLALNTITTLFALACVLLSFILFKDKIGYIRTLFISLLTIGSILFFHERTFLLSESFFLFFSLLACYTMDKAIDSNKITLHVVAGLLVLFACMTRIAAVALILSILLLASFRFRITGDRRSLFPFLTMILPIMFMLLWEYKNAGVSTYYLKLGLQKEQWVNEAGYASLLETLFRFYKNLGNMTSIGTILDNMIFSGYSSLLSSMLGFFFFCLFVWGLFVSLKRKIDIFTIYPIIYILMILVYIHDNSIPGRIWVPILPFLLFFMLVGFENIFSSLGTFAFRIITALCLLCYLVLGSVYMTRELSIERTSPFAPNPIKYVEHYDLQKLGILLKGITLPEEKYVCQHPNIMDLITERSGYVFPFSHNQERLFKLLDSKKIGYLFIDKKKTIVQNYLLPVIRNNPQKFKLIKEEPNAILYKYPQ